MSPAAFSSEPRSIYPSLWVPKMMMDREQAWLLLWPLGKHWRLNLAMVLGRRERKQTRGQMPGQVRVVGLAPSGHRVDPSAS